MKYLAVVAVASVSLAAAASGQLIYPILQDRHLEASVSLQEPNEPSDSVAAGAPDMEPWVHDLEVSVSSGDYPHFYGTLAAGAAQHSEIGTATLTAYGAAQVEAEVLDYSLWGLARAQSSYRVQFAVAAPVTYEISGFISAAGETSFEFPDGWWNASADVAVRLDQIAGPITFEQQASVYFVNDPNQPASDTHTLAAVGELSPGVYELEVVATVDALDLWLEHHYGQPPLEWIAEVGHVVDVVFTPLGPPPGCEEADTDGDGDVDLLDFARFERCFTGP
jgi:hypothetical protein